MNIAKEVIKESGLKLQLKLETKYSRSSGYYNRMTKTVGLDVERIKKETRVLRNIRSLQLTDEEVVEVITAHEVGHAGDDQLEKRHQERKKLEKEIEQCIVTSEKEKLKHYFKRYTNSIWLKELVAWRNAETFLLSNIDKTQLEVFKQYCLSTYKNSFKREYKKIILNFDLIKELKRIEKIFPGDITYRVTVNCPMQTYYNENKRTLESNVRMILRGKRNEYETISKKDYLLYEVLYCYLRKKSEIKKQIEEKIKKRVRIEKKEENRKQYGDVIEEQIKIQGLREEMVLNEMASLLKERKSFQAYRFQKEIDLKNEQKKDKEYYQEKFEKAVLRSQQNIVS